MKQHLNALLLLVGLLGSTVVSAEAPQPVCNPGLHYCGCDINIPGQCEEMRKQCVEPIDCGDGYGGFCGCRTAKAVHGPKVDPAIVFPSIAAKKAPPPVVQEAIDKALAK